MLGAPFVPASESCIATGSSTFTVRPACTDSRSSVTVPPNPPAPPVAPNCSDQRPFDPSRSAPGACGCGLVDNDGDGLADCLSVDNCPNDPGKTLPGICGCDTADTDADGDSIPDCVDPDANNPNEPPAQGAPMCGACGAGAFPGGLATLLLLGATRRRRRTRSPGAL